MFQESSLGLHESHQRLALLCDLTAIGKGADLSGFQHQSSYAVPNWFSVNGNLWTFKPKSPAPEAKAMIAISKTKMENVFHWANTLDFILYASELIPGKL